MIRGPRSRAGLMAYPVVPPRERPIAQTSTPTRYGPRAGAGPPSATFFRKDRGDTQDEHERPDDFAQKVRAEIADCRHGGEACELEIRIFGFAPVRPEMQPYQRRAGHGAEHLRQEEGRNFEKSPLTTANPNVTAGLSAASGLPHAVDT